MHLKPKCKILIYVKFNANGLLNAIINRISECVLYNARAFSMLYLSRKINTIAFVFINTNEEKNEHIILLLKKKIKFIDKLFKKHTIYTYMSYTI